MPTEEGFQFTLPLPTFSFQPSQQPGFSCSGWDASAGKQRTTPRSGNQLSRWARRLTQTAFWCQSPAWSGEHSDVRTGRWHVSNPPREMCVHGMLYVPVTTGSRSWLVLQMTSHIRALDVHTTVLTFSSFSILRITFSKLRQRTALCLHKSWLQQNGKQQQNFQPSVLTQIHKQTSKKPRAAPIEQPSWQSPGRWLALHLLPRLLQRFLQSKSGSKRRNQKVAIRCCIHHITFFKTRCEDIQRLTCKRSQGGKAITCHAEKLSCWGFLSLHASFLISPFKPFLWGPPPLTWRWGTQCIRGKLWESTEWLSLKGNTLEAEKKSQLAPPWQCSNCS